MKKCVVIINPKSGRGFKEKDVLRIINILDNYNYETEVFFTKYKGHATKLIKELEDDINLVISVGGDGTFSEVMNGNLKREKELLLSHLPVGTTNDIGHMYGLGTNIYTNLKLILEGKIQEVDVGFINNQAFTYVASFGKFMDIPYKTPQELKRRLGYFAYVIEVVKRVFNHIPKHDILVELDGIKHRGKYTFIILSNANRIAGINNFYNDVKLDDNKFEVMLCSLNKKRDILKAIYALKTSDVSYVSGIEVYKVSSIKITFLEKNKDMTWCVDGEEFKDDKRSYEIILKSNIKMLIPNKNIEKLFTLK